MVGNQWKLILNIVKGEIFFVNTRKFQVVKCNHGALSSLFAQSDFCKVYKVKDENMKKLDCASFPMVCGPMFLWSGPPGATKKFLPMDQRGDLSEIIFSLWSPL